MRWKQVWDQTPANKHAVQKQTNKFADGEHLSRPLSCLFYFKISGRSLRTIASARHQDVIKVLCLHSHFYMESEEKCREERCSNRSQTPCAWNKDKQGNVVCWRSSEDKLCNSVWILQGCFWTFPELFIFQGCSRERYQSLLSTDKITDNVIMCSSTQLVLLA